MGDSRLWLYDYGHCLRQPAVANSGRCGILGIDEAGRGSWVGPVVAAAVWILPEAYRDARLRDGCHGIDDSKKLKRAERETIFASLCRWREAGLLRVADGQADVAEIETHNIVGATALAMRRAVDALGLPCALPSGACVKIGGKRALAKASTSENISQQGELFGLPASALAGESVFAGEPTLLSPEGTLPVSPKGGLPVSSEGRLPVSSEGALPLPPERGLPLPPDVFVDGNPMPARLPWAHSGLIGADGISLAVAMASVWAKVTRDHLLAQMALEFPHYGWARNAGYGTRAHIAALREHGACRHHRPTYLRGQGLGG